MVLILFLVAHHLSMVLFRMPFYFFPLCQELCNPLVSAILDPIVIELIQVPSIGYSIRSMYNKVHLVTFVNCVCKLMTLSEQLGFAATPCHETMFVVSQHLFCFFRCAKALLVMMCGCSLEEILVYDTGR